MKTFKTAQEENDYIQSQVQKSLDRVSAMFEEEETNERYQGWTNWDTWNVHLWITNEALTYRFARSCKDPEGLMWLILGDDYLQEMPLYHDTKFYRVNWQEIHDSINKK